MFLEGMKVKIKKEFAFQYADLETDFFYVSSIIYDKEKLPENTVLILTKNYSLVDHRLVFAKHVEQIK